MRRIHLILMLAITFLSLTTIFVLADDCGSMSDCEETVGYNTGVAVVGGLIAVLIAGLVPNLISAGSGGTTSTIVPPTKPPMVTDEKVVSGKEAEDLIRGAGARTVTDPDGNERIILPPNGNLPLPPEGKGIGFTTTEIPDPSKTGETITVVDEVGVIVEWEHPPEDPVETWIEPGAPDDIADGLTDIGFTPTIVTTEDGTTWVVSPENTPDNVSGIAHVSTTVTDPDTGEEVVVIDPSGPVSVTHWPSTPSPSPPPDVKVPDVKLDPPVDPEVHEGADTKKPPVEEPPTEIKFPEPGDAPEDIPDLGPREETLPEPPAPQPQPVADDSWLPSPVTVAAGVALIGLIGLVSSGSIPAIAAIRTAAGIAGLAGAQAVAGRLADLGLGGPGDIDLDFLDDLLKDDDPSPTHVEMPDNLPRGNPIEPQEIGDSCAVACARDMARELGGEMMTEAELRELSRRMSSGYQQNSKGWGMSTRGTVDLLNRLANTHAEQIDLDPAAMKQAILSGKRVSVGHWNASGSGHRVMVRNVATNKDGLNFLQIADPASGKLTWRAEYWFQANKIPGSTIVAQTLETWMSGL